jgi:hypothetical protein
VTRRAVEDQPERSGVTRRSLIAGSGGVATTLAVTAVAPAAAIAAGKHEPKAVEIKKPATAAPKDPVVAWIHDAGRGEVTVVHGEHEHTYRDHALTKRLIAAADSSKAARKGTK